MLFLDLSFWEAGIRGLMAMLCQLIYPIMSFLYELFNNVTKINILSQKDIEPIYTRITMILTIIMVFYVTFQFVKYVIQPDGLTDKEKGAGPIIYKMIGVVALIAFVPIIFEKAYDLQNAIIGKNVISQVILGPQATIDEGNMGSSFSSTVFNMFYYVKDENKSASCHDGMDCETLVNYNVGLLKDENRLDSITLGLNETNGTETALINFDGFLAVIVGGFLVYILLLYCIDVGVRWVQLLYLQIIAPIPIIGFLSPKKDGIFQKWTKQCLTTYLDLFLRIGIINIVLLLCNELLISKVDSSSELLSGLGELSPMMETLIYVVLIMGVMLFAHKAPKMLGELFPKMGAASGNFGLSAKERGLKNAPRVLGAAAGTAVGAVVGAGSGLAQGWRRRKSLDKNGQAKGTGAGIWGATKGLVGGAIGGAARGLVNGGKKGNVLKNATAGAKNQIKANQRFGNREENGYTLGHQIGDTARGIFGAKSRSQVLEDSKAPIKRQDEALKHITDTESKIKDRALSKLKEGSGKFPETKKAADNLARREANLKALEDPTSDVRKGYQVGKVKHDSTSAQGYQKELDEKNKKINSIDLTAISNGITDASLGISQDDFKMKITEKQYDSLAHEKAKSNYIKPTGKLSDDGSPIMEFDEASWLADKDKFTTTKESEILDEQSYRKALKEAREIKVAEIRASEISKIEDEFNKNIQTYVYQTEEEAETALGRAKNTAAAALDDAQKAAVAAYVKYEGDGAITQTVAELKAYIDGDGKIGGYNTTASSDNQLSVDYGEIVSNFQAFSDKVKKDNVSGNYRTKINENAAKIINIDSEIDRIKRETEGSGINDGKKS